MTFIKDVLQQQQQQEQQEQQQQQSIFSSLSFRKEQFLTIDIGNILYKYILFSFPVCMLYIV